MSRPFNLVVFDWDGTLMDSEARIVACLRAAVLDLGLPDRDSQDFRNIIGLGLAEAVNMLYPGAEASLLQGLTDRYRYHYLIADPTPSQLFSGAAETVKSLAEKGYFLAVATGKGRRGLDKVLGETGLREYFDATRCSDETFSKPHPRMLLEIMDQLGTEPEETLMIGDSEYDMLMARNAKTDALAVSYGVHEPERLLKHGPLGIIDAISELEQWLEQGRRATKTAVE